MRNTLICGAALTISFLQGGAPTAQELRPATPGVIAASIACAAKPDQRYALYLPSNYSTDKKWPILYAFDPGARGKFPVERMKDAADRCGYIVVGSNNSRNGSWKLESEAAQAMFDDTHAHLSIDDRRVYFAGFSGGARVASALAQQCKCAAGVLLNGAGFSSSAPPSHDSSFPVFAAVGLEDFNYGEVTGLAEQLQSQHFPHLLRYFEGTHDWAPAAVMDEAFSWFTVLAIKAGLQPRDELFLAGLKQQYLDRARSFEQSNELFAAWREYRQAAETFAGLSDSSQFSAPAAVLEPQKSVREGAKRVKQEIEEQSELTRDISAGMASLRDNPAERSDKRSELEQRIVAIRERAAREKRPQRQRVLRRAVAGLLAQAMEAGSQPFDSKQFALARDYFQLATAADPASTWAWGNLAAAQAATADRKAALESLRRAREKTKDPAAFAAWLNTEPAFSTLREDPAFRALLTTNPGS